jgi:hypothetical protein
MADYQPDFLKLHRWSSSVFQTLPSQRGPGGKSDRVNTLPNSVVLLHSYIMTGWETGIRNQLRVLRSWEFTRAQFMEVILYARLAAGMRGLGHVYHAVGDMLPDYSDGDGSTRWPDGWAADPAAFKSGLDLTTQDLTPSDEANLTAWYEKNVGYLPDSIKFGIQCDPQLLKVHRAMWETAIKTLPKQIVPYLMIRDSMLANDRDALREAALLGKSWGLTSDWLVRGVSHAVNYNVGLRGMYAGYAVLKDLL